MADDYALPGMHTALMAVIDEDNEARMTGAEKWPIIGHAAVYGEIKAIIKRCKGLTLHYNCIDKAKITREVLGRGEVTLGALMVTSADGLSEYGHYFKPPYEFHAWVQDGQDIIDVGLAGVIHKGMTHRDEVGPFLVGRKPIVLAGKPKVWMRYQAHRLLVEV